jgi:MerR family redox-sensitive transcriptional activator SoxR
MRDDEPTLTIGQVARQAGTRTSRIRYYEAHGILPPPERVSGMRRYGPEVVRRLAIIDAAQRVGFSLNEIRELFADYGLAHERLRELAERKLPDIDELIQRAVTVRRLLVTCAVCECRSLEECRLFEMGSLTDAAPSRG